MLISPQKFLPNQSTDSQENATFEAKNTNPHAAIPSSAYNKSRLLTNRYQFEELYFHWGPSESGTGSEHSLDKAFFPAELQMLGFNSVLYRNMSEALNHAHGTVAISVMMRETDRDRTANRAIKAITAHVKKVGRGRRFDVLSHDFV